MEEVYNIVNYNKNSVVYRKFFKKIRSLLIEMFVQCAREHQTFLVCEVLSPKKSGLGKIDDNFILDILDDIRQQENTLTLTFFELGGNQYLNGKVHYCYKIRIDNIYVIDYFLTEKKRCTIL